MIPVVHQPLVWAMHRLGAAPWRAFDMSPVAPFGVPTVVNAIFWGALWGPVILWAGTPADGRTRRHLRAAIVTASLTMLVGAMLVRIGRGQPVPVAQRVTAVPAGLLINALWAGATSLLLVTRRSS